MGICMIVVIAQLDRAGQWGAFISYFYYDTATQNLLTCLNLP